MAVPNICSKGMTLDNNQLPEAILNASMRLLFNVQNKEEIHPIVEVLRRVLCQANCILFGASLCQYTYSFATD